MASVEITQMYGIFPKGVMNGYGKLQADLDIHEGMNN